MGGNLDTAKSISLDETLVDLCGEGVIDVFVDMKGGGYIGSIGIEVLLRGLRACRRRGGSLRVCGVSQQVRDVFQTMGLDRAIPLYEDRIGAILDSPPRIRDLLGVRERRGRGTAQLRVMRYDGPDRRNGSFRGGIPIKG
jgi:anti-anti-sigma factor